MTIDMGTAQADLPKPETMLTYASMLEKQQYVMHKGLKYPIATGEVVEAACAALRYCAALAVPQPPEPEECIYCHGNGRHKGAFGQFVPICERCNGSGLEHGKFRIPEFVPRQSPQPIAEESQADVAKDVAYFEAHADRFAAAHHGLLAAPFDVEECKRLREIADDIHHAHHLGTHKENSPDFDIWPPNDKALIVRALRLVTGAPHFPRSESGF